MCQFCDFSNDIKSPFIINGWKLIHNIILKWPWVAPKVHTILGPRYWHQLYQSFQCSVPQFSNLSKIRTMQFLRVVWILKELKYDKHLAFIWWWDPMRVSRKVWDSPGGRWDMSHRCQGEGRVDWSGQSTPPARLYWAVILIYKPHQFCVQFEEFWQVHICLTTINTIMQNMFISLQKF